MKEFHHAKIVTGKCPDCRELTILVFLADDFYRCVNCGADLEQKVNGVIKYIEANANTKMKLMAQAHINIELNTDQTKVR